MKFIKYRIDIPKWNKERKGQYQGDIKLSEYCNKNVKNIYLFIYLF